LAQESGSVAQLFHRGMRIAMMIGIVLPFFTQICGINVIIYYGPKVLKAAKLAGDAALLWQVVLGAVNVIFTVLAIFTVDRLGRKPLLLVGIVGIGLTLLASGFLFIASAPAIAILAIFAGFLACFAFSYGAVCWVIIAEIFPTAIRGRAMSISIFSLWTGCILVGQTFPLLLRHLGPSWTFWLYAFTTPLAFLFVLFFVPETKGKSLEQIERQFMH
jgi:MFS transporter, SP family, arabinose:H+ symporter